MNCPIHRNRQLSETLYCHDCFVHWTKEILDFFWTRYEGLIQDYERAIQRPKTDFDEATHNLTDYCERWRKGELPKLLKGDKQ